ncbi:hypothetical protein SAMN05518865_1082 [Duganella sp. CF458]|nr:hypothetical protein SAMN05518865_1082 [Duganella sp. CF458]
MSSARVETCEVMAKSRATGSLAGKVQHNASSSAASRRTCSDTPISLLCNAASSRAGADKYSSIRSSLQRICRANRAVYSTGRILRSDAMSSLCAEWSKSSVRTRTHIIDTHASHWHSVPDIVGRKPLEPDHLDSFGRWSCPSRGIRPAAVRQAFHHRDDTLHSTFWQQLCSQIRVVKRRKLILQEKQATRRRSKGP